MSSRTLIDGGSWDLTVRELFLAIVGLLLAIILGCIIANNIAQAEDEYNVKFYHAIQVSDSAQFNYAFKTNAGHMLAYGTVSAVGFVTDNGIGNYMSLTRDLEEYRKHHRTVCSGEGKNRHCHTETYWTWDVIKTERFHVDQVDFLGKRFYYFQFPQLPSERYVGTVPIPSGGFIEGLFKNRQRYVYHGRRLTYTGTMYTNAVNHTINDSKWADGITLDKAIDYYIREHGVLIFWIIFGVIIVVAIIFFVAAPNEWLNGSVRDW